MRKLTQEELIIHPRIQINNYTLLPNGNKILSLAPDNMPCIVPDMAQWNTMPNPAFHSLSHHRLLHDNYSIRQIPNAWTKPPVLIPE